MISHKMDFSPDSHHLGISLIVCKVWETSHNGFWYEKDFRFLPYKNLLEFQSDLKFFSCFQPFVIKMLRIPQ